MSEPHPGVAADPAGSGPEAARGARVLRARGDAMGDWLRPGDRVRLERRTPRRGDVALVDFGGRLVLQRVVRRRPGGWLVQGDARLVRGFVRDAQIVAVATARSRGDAAGGWTRIDGLLGRTRALAIAPARRVARALRRRSALRTP